MKYRITAARNVLACSVLFSFVACGISEATMGDTPPVAQKKETPKVAEKATPTSTQTLEEVEALVVSRWSKLTSIKASLLTTSFLNLETAKADTTTRGTIVYLRRDGNNFFLKDLKTRGTRTNPGHIERKVDTHAKYVCHLGACFYIYFNAPEPDKVFKSEVDSVETDFGGQGIFDYLRRNHIPSILPSKEFEGEKVFVIQAVGKPDTSYTGQLISAYISQKTGMLRKIVTEANNKNRLLTTTYRNVEVNPKVDPKIFDYTPSTKVRMIQKVMKK